MKMNIHEYQGKQILKRAGIPVNEGIAAFTVEEAVAAAKAFGEGACIVLKSQIHAGGRGAGRFINGNPDKGGVRVFFDTEKIEANAKEMLGEVLVTKQTGPEGKQVNRLYVENGCDIAHEYYVSVLLDRALSKVMIMASTEGGMDIETVAEQTPEKIIQVYADPDGLSVTTANDLAAQLGMTGNTADQAADVFIKLVKTYMEKDMDMLEVNPLVTTPDGDIIALDAKISFDSNALYRHPDIQEMRDETEEDPMENEAEKWQLNYVNLEGNIGCMVNGAGLAMATMDIIQMKGAMPANFLDVGGTATAERVAAAFKIILSDDNVQGILINIFGGIVRCDMIAEGIIEAAKQVGVPVPLVVRLEGTNVEKGKQILAESDVNVVSADTLEDAAEKIVALV